MVSQDQDGRGRKLKRVGGNGDSSASGNIVPWLSASREEESSPRDGEAEGLRKRNKG